MGATGERERLLTGDAGRLFLTVSVGWLLIQLSRQVLPPLLPTIIADLEITSARAGVALSVMWGLYALLQYPSGRLSDLLTRKTLLVAGLALLCIGLAIVSATVSYPMFVGGVAVIGLGAGLYPTAARALVSDLYVDRRGQAFGIHTASGDLGNAAAAGLAVAAVAVASWRSAFLPLVACFAVLLVLIHAWSSEGYVLRPVGLGARATARRVFGATRLRGVLAAYVLFAFTWQSTTGFLPTLLQADKGFTVGLASGGFAVFFGVGMLVKPVAGVVGDRVGRATVAIGSLGVGLAGLASVVALDHPVGIFLGIVVYAAGLMSYPPVMQAFLMDLFPDESMGGDLGGMRTVYIGLGSLGPTYVGVVAGMSSYTVAFLGLAPCVLASAAIIAVVERRAGA